MGSAIQCVVTWKDLVAEGAQAQNRAAVGLVPKLRPWNAGTHVREWSRLLGQVPTDTQRAIFKFRWQCWGWFCLLLGSLIAAVATGVDAFV
jgi:hypothetical protein